MIVFGLPGVVGTVVGGGIGALIVWRSEQRWLVRAHRLAAKRDLPLPDELAFWVAKWLRLKAALTGFAGTGLGLFNSWAFSSVFASDDGHTSPGTFEIAMLMLPGLLIGYGLACSAAGWNAKNRSGAAHFTKPRIREVFVAGEWLVLGGAALMAVVLGGWGLQQHGDRSWTYAWPITVAVTGTMWWIGSRAILNRRSRAATDLELQWDDLLRYQRARDFTIIALCGPAFYAAILNAMASPSMFGNLVVLGAASLIAALGYPIFRRGRDLWRRPWQTALG